jgi:hypothetical protein
VRKVQAGGLGCEPFGAGASILGEGAVAAAEHLVARAQPGDLCADRLHAAGHVHASHPRSPAPPQCGSFKETGNGEYYTEAVSPVSLTAGDESLAWRSEMSNGGQTFTLVECVVRVGSTVAAFAELAPKNPSLPVTKQSIIDAQVSKMRAISKS